MKTMLTALALASLLAGAALPAKAESLGRAAHPPAAEDVEVADRDRRGDGETLRRDGSARLGDTVLSERRIARLVRRSGFVDIGEIRLRRDRYVVTATRPNGAVFRLAVDAFDGDIIARERIGWTGRSDHRDFDRFREGGRGALRADERIGG